MEPSVFQTSSTQVFYAGPFDVGELTRSQRYHQERGLPVSTTSGEELHTQLRSRAALSSNSGPIARQVAEGIDPEGRTTVNYSQTDLGYGPVVNSHTLSYSDVGRIAEDPAGEAEEWNDRLLKWHEVAASYHDTTIMTGVEGGGSVGHQKK